MVRRRVRRLVVRRRRVRRGNPTGGTAVLKDTRLTVTCAFCRGRGKDPFGVLSHLSDCQVCLGRGTVKIEGPTKQCQFCGGNGIQPYTTSRLHCLACRGKGVVTALRSSKACPVCEGDGVYPRRPHPAPCPTCKGQGAVAK